MAKLKVTYNTAEEIPEGFADLYTEKDGKFALTEVEGIKTQADIDKIQGGLRLERNDHKATKEKLAAFGDIDPATIPSQLEELTATKAQLDALTAAGGFDETKIEPIIEARVNRAVGPLQREKTQLQRDLDLARKGTAEKEVEVNSLKQTMVQRDVEGAIRSAATGAKVLPTAIDDAVMNGVRVFEVVEDGRILTRDIPGSGITVGLTPAEWFKDMVDKRPHWWPISQGGGAQGGRPGGLTRSENPWSTEGWNLTRQGAYIRQNGEAKAAEIAAQVGSKIGATHATKAGTKAA